MHKLFPPPPADGSKLQQQDPAANQLDQHKAPVLAPTAALTKKRQQESNVQLWHRTGFILTSVCVSLFLYISLSLSLSLSVEKKYIAIYFSLSISLSLSLSLSLFLFLFICFSFCPSSEIREALLHPHSSSFTAQKPPIHPPICCISFTAGIFFLVHSLTHSYNIHLHTHTLFVGNTHMHTHTHTHTHTATRHIIELRNCGRARAEVERFSSEITPKKAYRARRCAMCVCVCVVSYCFHFKVGGRRV